MKKVLYIITKTNFGGAQKYVRDMALNLARSGNYDVFLAVGEGPESKWLGELRSAGVNIIRLKHVRRNLSPWHDFMSGYELYNLFQDIRPDVIHLNSSKVGATGSTMGKIYNRLENKKTKIIYTVHGLVLKERLTLWRKTYYWLAEWLGSRFKDVLIAVSENDKQALLDWKIAAEGKIKVIHNGINFDGLNFLERTEARQKLSQLVNYNIGPALIIGTVAGYYRNKGLGHLIKAADQVVKSLPAEYDKAKIKFLLIGSGPEKEYLQKKINRYKLKSNVTLLSIEENAAQYLKAFDMFALPSVKEGLPYTLIEARAAGLPIIASNVGGVPEIIEHQKTGLLVKPGDYQMLSKTISDMLKDENQRKALGKNASVDLEKFSIKQMIRKTAELY